MLYKNPQSNTLPLCSLLKKRRPMKHYIQKKCEKVGNYEMDSTLLLLKPHNLFSVNLTFSAVPNHAFSGTLHFPTCQGNFSHFSLQWHAYKLWFLLVWSR